MDEVTPAMIEAGAKELRWFDVQLDSYRETAESIFRAMQAVQRDESKQGKSITLRPRRLK